MSRLHKWLANIALLSVALSVSLLAGEFAARLVLQPMNYLNPTLVRDEFLSHRIEGGTGGHDEWGFRNFSLPDSAEIVAVGDSMTYGVSALADESYPLVLARIRGSVVYNMGLGGYGPLQYLHLIRTRVPQLKPKTVVVGFYFGNDVMDAFNLAHGFEAWRDYSQQPISEQTEARVLARSDGSGKAFGGLRDWLSRNSVLYRVVANSSAFDRVREGEFKARDGESVEATLGARRMLFAWQDPAVYLDLGDPRGVEGLAITERAFREIGLEARKSGVRLLVVMFPLKESVYEQHLSASATQPGVERLLSLVDNERKVKARMQALFRSEGIEYLDLLPALRAANADEDAYPLTDSHPNARGYAAVAAAVQSVLSRPPSTVR